VSGGAIAARVVYIYQVEDETTHGRGEGWKEAVEQKLRPNCLQEKSRVKVAAVKGKVSCFSSAKKV
jgi:hypothetical protein